ncbi:MAG TPA: tetratricopeptide repeat protein [bacterium]|nr:tetratricopeptide repeat protein [bacterium]
MSFPARAEQDFVDYYRMGRAASQGTDLFNQGKYDLARAGYMRAKDMSDEKSSESYRLHFNIGDTFYKEGNYDEAQKEYDQALAAADPEVREQAYYNLGNVYFKQGMKEQKIETLEKAVENYQNALQINPDDQDAKFNIEVVRRNIKLKKQQQQPKPQNQQGQQNQQNQQGQEKKPEPNQEPEPAAGSTAEQQQKPDEEAKPAGSAREQGKISEEEAKRLLQAVQQSEEEDMKKFMESYQPQQRGKEKDW